MISFLFMNKKFISKNRFEVFVDYIQKQNSKKLISVGKAIYSSLETLSSDGNYSSSET